MPNEFIGLRMLVTVRDPPAKLQGTVCDVKASTSLTLRDVWILDTNQWQQQVTIQSKNIVDLAEIPSGAPSFPQPVAVPEPAVVVPQPAAFPYVRPAQPLIAPQQPKQPLADPAIVTVGRRPGVGSHGLVPPQVSDATIPRAPESIPVPATQTRRSSQDATPTGVVAESLGGLKIQDYATTPDLPAPSQQHAATAPEQDAQEAAQQKKRRQRKPANPRNGAGEDVDASPHVSRVRQSGRGKGWRQTPILESTASFQPFSSLKKHAGGKGKAANDNGWASEDVTDVQEMGDFNFEEGLARFDKRNLFEQMRKEDPTDDADRLVSHNRQRPKPGTAGGKNLHYTENVLDMPSTVPKGPKEKSQKETNDFWNSEADDGILNGGERLSGRELGSRQSSRRGESKVSGTRRSQSRKASTAPGHQGPNRAHSGVGGGNLDRQCFHLVPSNRRVDTVSALQMLNLENIAHNELGLTEDMMTENAGRGVAEVTLSALKDPAIKVRHAASVDPATGNNPPPTVVILAGNNKSGIRAVAAGRHLRNKGINVLLCVVGIERGERELLEDMRQQVHLFRNFGGRVFSKADFFEHLRKASIPVLTIDTPRTSLTSLTNPQATVTLIIDAVLGLAISFEELRTSDQATVYELIEWSNRNEAFVLAIDVPSGIDPSSGKITVVDGSRLYVRPRYVVALGAPKRGLLAAMAAGSEDAVARDASPSEVAAPDDSTADWKLYVADIGLGAAVWKKAGTKMRRGINFEDKWVFEMRYQGNTEDELA
ncbi:hypothetical protein VTK73DRAFT_877 [Phialemonium thermophilum]|uniref:Enhancer of mRNA-decapping protein 3 n=1 Tax=Phialemonium thermophilum TaxID=223376 RepID=A0ABR3Y370_9PEZI